MLTVSVLMVSMPAADAAVVYWDTYSYLMIAPNPVGINQPVLVTFQIDKTNPLATIRANLWQGCTVKITKPDGTTETKGPFELYSMSNNWFTYTPTKVGTYTFEGNFPGQWVNVSYTSVSAFGSFMNVTGQPLITENRWYKPTTITTTLTVQQDPIQSIADNPLPTSYWTRPINSENKGWARIADNWLMQGYDYLTYFTHGQGVFAPYTSAPESAHVLWNKPLMFGGEIGGKFGDQSYYTGLTYEQFYNPIIINGRIIYAERGPSNAMDIYGTRCLDLYTGEEVWYLENVNIAFAQVYEFDSGNEHGGLPYLWSTSGSATNSTWKMYDAFSGTYLLTVTNITSGTTVFGPKGELLSYSLVGSKPNRNLLLWNSTLAIAGTAVFDTWSPRVGSVIDGKRGIQWNVSIPDEPGVQAISFVSQGYLLTGIADLSVYPNVYCYTCYNIDLARDASGKYPTSISRLWAANRTTIYDPMGATNKVGTQGVNDNSFAFFSEDTLIFHGYDIRTGAEIWQTDPLPRGWAIFTYCYRGAYGKLYEVGYDGYFRAYDVTNGKLVWEYYFGSAGYENAYGTYPVYNGFTIADGKIYVSNDEHSPDSIMWRGGKLWCIDAETGEGLWNISGMLRHPVISDGILTAVNSLDGQIYTIGKGPSATTVTAPQTAVPKGTAVVITGKVTDQSPGQKDTPAISDASMSAWMEYLHMQKPMPVNAKGVDVTISVVDPNGNTVVLGNAISDIGGSYGFSWTPEIQGLYQIIATFAGTNSYGSSYATTYMSVGPAQALASPTVTPTQTATPTTTQTATPTASPSVAPTPPGNPGLGSEVYIAIAAVAIIVAIVAVAIILRRRK